jgi:N-6 DNA Methylase
MKDFFAYIRREQRKILAQYGGPVEFCQELLAEDGEECLPDKLADVFSAAEPDERDYAIASAYSLLIGEKRRRELSAFFTPPMLSRAVLEASADILDRCEHPRVLDPACGGGSFLTPVVRHLIGKGVQRGLPLEQACEEALGNLHGIEIDSGLATLSQTLLRSSLAREFGFTSKRRLTVVRCADALDETPGKRIRPCGWQPSLWENRSTSRRYAAQARRAREYGRPHESVCALSAARSRLAKAGRRSGICSPYELRRRPLFREPTRRGPQAGGGRPYRFA